VVISCRQALGDLEDRFNSLESGSRSMVSQVILSAFLACMICGTEYLRRRRDWLPSKGRRLGLNLNRLMLLYQYRIKVYNHLLVHYSIQIFDHVKHAYLILGRISDEYIGDPSRSFFPVLVKHPNKSIIRGGLLVVIPFFSVGSDKVLVVRLDGQERVHGLLQGLERENTEKNDMRHTLKGDEEDLR
jgi:hypothetical protein